MIHGVGVCMCVPEYRMHAQDAMMITQLIIDELICLRFV